LAILLLLILAMAEPHVCPPRQIALVIDNSASMSATDVAPSRLERAKQLAREWIHSLGYRDQVAVLSCAEPARIVAGLTGRREVLYQAIDAIAPSEAVGEMLPCLATARLLLARSPESKIVVFSDGCFSEAAEVARAADVAWVTVGGESDNVAVTQFCARREIADPARCQVLVEVSSYSHKPVDCSLEFKLEGKRIDRVSVHLSPAARWQQIYELKRLEAGRLDVQLDPPDALPIDNAASVRLPPCPTRHVILVDRQGLHLRRALESNPRVELSVAQAVPSSLDPHAILVLHRCGADRLSAGASLVIAPIASGPLWQSGEPVAEAVVVRQDDESPVLAGVRLVGTRWPGARRLVLTEQARSIARPIVWAADGTPLAYQIASQTARMLLLSGDPGAGELSAQPALPLLMSNAIEWLAGDDPRSGPAVEVSASAGCRLRDELDVRVPAELRGVAATWSTLAEAALWWYFAGAACVVVVVEWGLYQRRWTC